MRRRIEIAILVILAATVVILFLNLRETDDYPPGIDPESPSSLPTWIAPILAHPCPWCELCPHRFELAETKLAVTITDRDGWHRLFWSGAETYTYDDPAFVGAALRNRTAEFAGGTWTIRGRYVPAITADAHPCPPAATEVDLRYVLRRGVFQEIDPVRDPSGTLTVPLRWLWFRYPYPPDRLDDFYWELENPTTFAGTERKPCACGLQARER
jgi:hypothetical protein